MRWNRFLRFLVGLICITVGIGFTVFVYSNDAILTVHWRDWSVAGVHIWELTLVPVLLGLALGYLYHLPARLHHLREHVRHRHRVHELEQEVKELRTSLDKVLMMPEDGSMAVPATLLPDKEPEPEETMPVLLEATSLPRPRRARAGSVAKVTVKAAKKPAPPRRKLVSGPQAEPAEVGPPPPANGRSRRSRAAAATKPAPEAAG